MVFSYLLTHAIYAQPKSFQPRSKWLKLQKLRSPPPLPVQMLKPFREPQKQKGKTNQFGCGRPTGAADLKHANQQQQQRRWRAKQLKPENCRPGNKQFGREERNLFSHRPLLSILGRSSPPAPTSGVRQFTLMMLPLFQRGWVPVPKRS